MEENINIFALVLDELNKNDMWFTTKADPTAEEASSYYKLDEYGEPTEATVKKIEKEVTSLIGDGAVDIYDAVELWVNDALVAFRIDYKDNLVTQFEDKPVVDNIEAYENPVQFPQSKKVEGKQLAYISELQKDTLLKVDEMCNKGMSFTDVWYELQKDGYDLKCYNRNHKRGSDMPTRGMLYKDGEFSFVTIINGRNGKCSWETEGPTYYTEAKTKKTEYYVMSDDEHIIWDSEVDYYDDDYMEKVKRNQYQDYLNDLEEDETPEDFETWYADYVEVASYDDWNYLEDDLKNNIFPEIDKQVNDDVLILSGYYGSNYPDFKSSGAGGELFEKGTKDFDDYMSDFDRVCITSQNGILGTILSDHDGTISGQFYTLPDDKSELFKALDLENKVKEDYADQEIDWENETVGEYDSIGNYRNYDLEDLIEKEFYELLEYGGLDARDFTTHIELLKPIKDTISGYANKSESKKVKTETYKPTEDEKVGKMKDTNGTFFDVYQHGDKFLDVLGNELSKEEVAEYVKKYTKTEKMNGFNSENAWAEKLFDDLKEAEDIDTEKWNNSSSEERVAMIKPIIIKFYKENRDKIDDNWDDFMELLEYWNYHTEYKIFNDLAYDEILNVDENKKVESLGDDNHDYVSKYDELDDLLNTFAGTDEDKLNLYNYFNSDKLLKDLDGENEYLYDDWLFDFRKDHYDELRTYLDEKDEELGIIMNKISESKKAERKKKQIEAFKNRKVNFNKRTKEENYQRRLDEVNNKSKNLISDLFSSNDFDSDSPAGQIVMRTSEMFNALSDKGYDVEVTFDNGESTSAIQLGQQGGKVMITITNTNQPLRAFTSGNFEINDENIKILQDIQSQIEVL